MGGLEKYAAILPAGKCALSRKANELQVGTVGLRAVKFNAAVGLKWEAWGSFNIYGSTEIDNASVSTVELHLLDWPVSTSIYIVPLLVL